MLIPIVDPQERKWYDDHRDAILAGWSANDAENNNTADVMLFNVAPYMHPGCFSSYSDGKGGFYQTYQYVFHHIVSCERKQTETIIELPTNFGNSTTSWEVLSVFYKSWECFSSALNFAWEDTYNAREDAPSRRVRRLMEEENNKARKAAKKVYKNDILQLVAFVKKRDSRYKAHLEEQERLKKEREERQKEEKLQRKKEQQKAKEAWREAMALEMEKEEEEDRLRGRIRLADLEDDYDYGGGKKKKRGKKKNRKQQAKEKEQEELAEAAAETIATNPENGDENSESGEATPASPIDGADAAQNDDDQQQQIEEPLAPEIAEDDVDYSESESEDEPESWRCDICRKEFKSEGQYQNHLRSKKHKEAVKKHEAKMKKKEQQIMAEMMDEMGLDDQ